MHRVVIKIQSSYDEWCEPEPEDRLGLDGLELLFMLSFCLEFPRRCIRQLVRDDEGQNRFLDIDASVGNLTTGLCNPATDMLFIDGTSAMFPFNLRDIPVIGISVQVERVGGVGPSLACEHLARIVAPHYTAYLSQINAVYAWRMNPRASSTLRLDITCWEASGLDWERWASGDTTHSKLAVHPSWPR
ncbi:hypothetical protein FACUT_3200 [Fusarium acutatum]|uniref:Uncharacterized protein n=1 Tax=Fusarium acutatum TaxID=78861 RepID=A0A8H4JZJ5_9HYPO|nr:hypothetical protein FACUT_3200 [Fusarium acutatum]